VEQIEAEFSRAGLAALPPAAYEQLQNYLDLLLRWNQRLNLTAIREPLHVIQRHFVESAFVAQHLPTGVTSLLDYGSGAGLPGIPIAICRPEIRVTLAEAQGKKASFLQEALRVLALPGQVYRGRVEAMPEQSLFDAVSMRAVEKMESAIPIAAKRARQYLVLLTTGKSAAASRGFTPELEWLEPVPLPNSAQMILAIGQRKNPKGSLFHVEHGVAPDFRGCGKTIDFP
jgi:16S rRNA (guanine527-N7)-methyltransferase